MPDSETLPTFELLGDAQANSSEAVTLPKLFGAPEWLLTLVLVMQLLTLPFAEPGPSWLGNLSRGLCLGLPSMLAVWSSIRSGDWRFCLTVFLSLVNGGMLTPVGSLGFELFFFLLPLGIALPTLLMLFLVKRRLGRFALLKSKDEYHLQGVRAKPSHLLIVTALLALLVAVGNAYWPVIRKFIAHPDEILVVVSLIVLFSSNALMFVWTLMGQRVVFRTCVAIPISVMTLFVCFWACGLSGGKPEIVTWCLGFGAPLALSFLLMVAFRCSGWRFWKGRVDLK